MKKDSTTEEKIKEAARQVFLTKGFAGCSSREIAKAAGENVALVNYYFRSKQQLFKLIFEAAMEDFILSMIQVFSSERSLIEKMRIFIEHEYAFLAKHPELPSFIVNEMNREDGCNIDHHATFQKVAQTGIFNECLIAQNEGRMRKVSLPTIPILIMSNCHYPIMAKNLFQTLHDLTDEQYVEILVEHQKNVTEMLIEYLFPTNENK
jgi:AcrR family transcriptional regulator